MKHLFFFEFIGYTDTHCVQSDVELYEDPCIVNLSKEYLMTQEAFQFTPSRRQLYGDRWLDMQDVLVAQAFTIFTLLQASPRPHHHPTQERLYTSGEMLTAQGRCWDVSPVVGPDFFLYAPGTISDSGFVLARGVTANLVAILTESGAMTIPLLEELLRRVEAGMAINAAYVGHTLGQPTEKPALFILFWGWYDQAQLTTLVEPSMAIGFSEMIANRLSHQGTPTFAPALCLRGDWLDQ